MVTVNFFIFLRCGYPPPEQFNTLEEALKTFDVIFFFPALTDFTSLSKAGFWLIRSSHSQTLELFRHLGSNYFVMQLL